MNWTDLLNARVAEVYGATAGLMNMVEEKNLDWRPETGSNWMTMGQLLEHIPTASGHCMMGFVTGDWKIGGVDFADMAPEDMLPSAEKMPTVKSVADAKKALAVDKAIALDMIAKAGEKTLAEKMVAAPWNPTPLPMGVQLLSMVGHLDTHKAQLFYYLKLQGQPVHTGSLYGMG